MPPWVSVVLPVYNNSDTFVKLLLPIAALKTVDAAKWYWDPARGDAYSDTLTTTLLQTANIYSRPRVDIIEGVWDFRLGPAAHGPA